MVLAVAVGAAVWLAWWGLARPLSVDVVRPQPGSAADVVYATGVVEPVRWAKVTSVLRERIVEMCECEGADVMGGTVLGRLDASDARATLAELEARAELSEQQRRRASGLLERRVISQETFDQAENAHSRNVALIAAQTARLSDYELRAPMNGQVLRRDGEVGEVAEPGEVLFWVGQPSPLHVIADVNEEDIPRVEAGQAAIVRADAFPEQTFEAVVDRITPKGDPVLKTYRVYLTFPSEPPLMIGMTSDVNIVVRVVDDAMLIPLAALDGDRVLVLDDDGRLSERRLEIGIRGTRHVEVLSGLSPEDQLVAVWREGLTPGDRATASKPEPAS